MADDSRCKRCVERLEPAGCHKVARVHPVDLAEVKGKLAVTTIFRGKKNPPNRGLPIHAECAKRCVGRLWWEVPRNWERRLGQWFPLLGPQLKPDPERKCGDGDPAGSLSHVFSV